MARPLSRSAGRTTLDVLLRGGAIDIFNKEWERCGSGARRKECIQRALEREGWRVAADTYDALRKRARAAAAAANKLANPDRKSPIARDSFPELPGDDRIKGVRQHSVFTCKVLVEYTYPFSETGTRSGHIAIEISSDKVPTSAQIDSTARAQALMALVIRGIDYQRPTLSLNISVTNVTIQNCYRRMENVK